jgi:class 3 adenylate cyclase
MWVARLLTQLRSIGARPGETPDRRVRRETLVIAAILIVVLATAWTAIYATLGLELAAAIPLAYQLATIAGLLVLARTRGFEAFRATQLALMLTLPFALQWTLGGFERSSSVGLWALVTAVGAVYFLEGRRAIPWFVAFAGLVVLSALIDGRLRGAAPEIPEAVRIAFFALNILGVSIVTYLLLQYFVRQREAAQRATDTLLLAVLPAPIADQLKAGAKLIADRHDDVTVLFADIVDFTPTVAGLSPEEVVGLLDRVFSAFDHLAERHGLEKIKTIGDAYMVVGGAPVSRPDHGSAVAEMALDMLEEAARCSREGLAIRLRIGMDRGPVIAGVIGRHKFIYDLWGDTVNTASRMESHGIPDAIQVTRAVQEGLRGQYRFEARGVIDVKGKGRMSTWLLLGRA